MKKYPDISELLAQKKRLRSEMAQLPFERKIEIVFKLNARREFIKSGKIKNDKARQVN